MITPINIRIVIIFDALQWRHMNHMVSQIIGNRIVVEPFVQTYT